MVRGMLAFRAPSRRSGGAIRDAQRCCSTRGPLLGWRTRRPRGSREDGVMRRRTVRTITSSTWFLVLALLVSFGMPAGAAPQAPANVNVSALAGNDAEDAIAINPTNPSNIVAMSVLPVG